MDFKNTVAIRAAETYDEEKLVPIIREQMDALELTEAFFEHKKVAIKPNLVMRKSPDAAATVHPAIVSAVLTVLNERGVSPIIAESPGGIFNKQRLEGIYKGCGIMEVANRHDVTLNYDTEAQYVKFPEGKKVKTFHVINPIAEADVVFDLCKLKSHSLTKMSAAIKNFFGVIPGIEKFEMHATFPDYKDFSAMICDLCQMLYTGKEIIAVTDAIVGMEGDGPTSGIPRKIGAVTMSRNPFASDLVNEAIIGFTGTVPIVKEAISRGLCPEKVEEITIIGDKIEDIALHDFVEPEAAKNKATSALSFFSGGKIGRFFMPKPVPMWDQCRGCGECVASCPQHTIHFETVKGKKIAKMDYSNCIRCYCCQELCPFGAIKVKKNLIIKIISSI